MLKQNATNTEQDKILIILYGTLQFGIIIIKLRKTEDDYFG